MEWHILPTGRVWVEPGGAFGLVPEPLWGKHQQLDDRRRAPMDLNSLLIFSEGKTILVDNGLGHKLPPKAIEQWGLEWPEGTLEDNLAKHGLTPNDIDIVINTHLHADHCSGNTILSEGGVSPAFLNAKYFVQRLEFADASHPNSRTRATYIAENFIPVWERGQYTFLHGDTSITKHVSCILTRGHTRGHQAIMLRDEHGPALFVSDLASYAVHFARQAWVTAYDIEPLETIQTKQHWRKWAIETKARLIFQHDTQTRIGRLIEKEDGAIRMETLQTGSVDIPQSHTRN